MLGVIAVIAVEVAVLIGFIWDIADEDNTFEFEQIAEVFVFVFVLVDALVALLVRTAVKRLFCKGAPGS